MSSRRLSILVGLVIRVVLVDGIVCQMNKRVVEGFGLVLFSGETGKTVLEHEDPQGMNIGHENINSEVKLIVVDQVWGLEVLLYD